MRKSYGVEVYEGYADLDIADEAEEGTNSKPTFRATITDGNDQGTAVQSKNCFLMPGARNGQILEEALERGKAAEGVLVRYWYEGDVQ